MSERDKLKITFLETFLLVYLFIGLTYTIIRNSNDHSLDTTDSYIKIKFTDF